MRVSQFTLYNNFLVNHQKDLNDLTKIQTQIATGKKIDKIYDDTVVYSKYLQLNEEMNTFEQISTSASTALSFARETDTTINDMINTLTSFKTKLLQAANDTQDNTSREAVVSDLKGMLNHLKDLANTSINGKYIFSGSAFDKKPINDEYKYEGNNKHVKAFLGAGVEREYNIPGNEIFFGMDSDYKKHITLNIAQYDKLKANPEFVVKGDDGNLYIDKTNPTPYEDRAGINESITADSEIRSLTGVSDIKNANGSYSSGDSMFIVKGKDSDGNTFSKAFSLSNSDKVSDLLDKIGTLYGNTSDKKVVDVYLNDLGQIQIKDLKTGKLDTNFWMAAVNAKDYDSTLSVEDNLKNIAKNGNYFVEFQRSDLNTIRDLSEINATNTFLDNRVFKFGAVFKSDGRNAISADTLDRVFGTKGVVDGSDDVDNADFVVLSGSATDGSLVDDVALKIDNNMTMQDILNTIKDKFKADAKIENGEIIITDSTIEKNGISKLEINIKTVKDDNGDGVYEKGTDTTKIETIRRKDTLNMDEIYFEKSANTLISNTPQITRSSSYYIKDGKKMLKTMDEVYANENTLLTDVMGDFNFPKTLNIRYKDIKGEFKTATITIEEDEITFSADGKNSRVYDAKGNITPAFDTITTTSELDPVTCQLCEKENIQRGFTYKQLSDVVAMIVSGNMPDDNAASYEESLKKAKEVIESGLDDKGRFYIKEKSATTKIEFSMFDKSGSLSFESNNAITIDSAENDFFSTLKNAIAAVENGKNFADGYSNNPRNYGIQGALEAIEHVMDRVRRSHAKIGALSNEFDITIQRVEMLKVNVQKLQSDNIDTDIGEASMKLNSIKTSYEALLASIAKVNNLTLLNYLR